MAHGPQQPLASIVGHRKNSAERFIDFTLDPLKTAPQQIVGEDKSHRSRPFA
jgi:hypothetical protein